MEIETEPVDNRDNSDHFHPDDSKQSESEGNSTNKRGVCCGKLCWCCSNDRFNGNHVAQGIASLGSARSTIVITNLFLSTALIYLASVAAGCDMEQPGEQCDNKVYGFRPSSLITNISIISGILGALLMPIVGAFIDYTPHRRTVGVLSAFLIFLIQGVQIGTVQATWFPMAVLQAIAGFLYNVQCLALFAFLPELGNVIGEKLMTKYNGMFSAIMYISQVIFLIVIIGISTGLGFNDVQIAHLSQSIDTVYLLWCFTYGWKILPSVPSLHDLPEGTSIWTAGFARVWKTAKGINKHYSGLRWFLLAIMFASPGVGAFTIICVTYMVEVLQMNGSQIGIVFLICITAAIPGTYVGTLISRKTNPVLSLKLNMVVFSGTTIAGCFVLKGPEYQIWCYLFGGIWGSCLGWFYPTENAIFSLIVPQGQASELAGFFIYCTQIIVWLPPMIFTIMNESGVNMRWGLMSLVMFYIIGFIFLMFMDRWDNLLATASINKIISDNQSEITDKEEDEENSPKDSIKNENKIGDMIDVMFDT